MPDVVSSCIAALDYDEGQKTLLVSFVYGGSYLYYEIPPEEYQSFLAADSKGRYYNNSFEPQYGNK